MPASSSPADGAAGSGSPSAPLPTSVRVATIGMSLLGAFLLVLAGIRFLPRRHAWARWLGLAAFGVVTLIVLFGAIAAGGSRPSRCSSSFSP